jgi:hypothetical protein
MTGISRVAIAGLVAAVLALASAGAANADNSNTNTNNNDVTQQGGGDGSDMSGSEKTNWPPTDLSWPPKDVTNGGVGSGGSGNKGGDDNSAPPIVMAVGQPAPQSSATATPSPSAKPIVPVSTP